MVRRLLAALGLLLAGWVVLPASPASACGCVTDQPDELADNAAFAFVGVLVSQRSDDDHVAHRFAVESVHKGAVRRTQDVVTPNEGQAGCGVEWETGARMVVLGHLDEEGRPASNLCSGSATSTDPAYDAVVTAPGPASEPLPGRSVVELDRWSTAYARWFTLAVAVIGLSVIAVQLTRRRRARG